MSNMAKYGQIRQIVRLFVGIRESTEAPVGLNHL